MHSTPSAKVKHGRYFIGALLCLALTASGGAASRAIFEIFRSVDDGLSWTKVGEGLPPDLRVDALGRSGSVRLAGTERGIFISADDGATWRRPRHGTPEQLKIFDIAGDDTRAYAASARGLWVSADAGETWSGGGETLAAVKVLSLGLTAAGLWAGTDGQGVFRRRAADSPWEAIGEGLPDRAQVFQFAVQGGAVFAALYSRGVYRHDPTSGKWVSPGTEHPLRLVAFDGRLFAGRNPGGVFISDNGGADWTDASRALPAYAPTWALAQTSRAVLLGTTGHAGLMRFEQGSAGWTVSDGGLPKGGAAIAFGVTEKSILVAVIADR